jgi:hypothetical protein
MSTPLSGILSGQLTKSEVPRPQRMNVDKVIADSIDIKHYTLADGNA